MSRNAARNEAADRRFATASIPGGTKAGQASNFGAETPYLSLGNVTPDECRAAAVTVCDIALRMGHGDQCDLTEGLDPRNCEHPGHLADLAVSDEVLTTLGLKDFAR